MYGNYICKSNLGQLKKDLGNRYKHIPVSCFEKQFKNCRDSKIIITGSRFDESRMRRTKVVNVDELKSRILACYVTF